MVNKKEYVELHKRCWRNCLTCNEKKEECHHKIIKEAEMQARMEDELRSQRKGLVHMMETNQFDMLGIVTGKRKLGEINILYDINEKIQKVEELTYQELFNILKEKLEENPKLGKERAIILMGTEYSSRSSYIRGLKEVRGEIVIQGSYCNGKAIKV